MTTDPTSDDRSLRAGHDRSATESAAAVPPRTDSMSGERSSSTAAAEPRDDSPCVVVTDPSLDEHQGQGITGGTWIALILGTLILIMLLIFILQNNVEASFAYFGWQFTLPLGVAMLFAAIAGVLIAALLGSVRLFKLSRRVRKLEKERASIKRAIG